MQYMQCNKDLQGYVQNRIPTRIGRCFWIQLMYLGHIRALRMTSSKNCMGFMLADMWWSWGWALPVVPSNGTATTSTTSVWVVSIYVALCFTLAGIAGVCASCDRLWFAQDMVQVFRYVWYVRCCLPQICQRSFAVQVTMHRGDRLVTKLTKGDQDHNSWTLPIGCHGRIKWSKWWNVAEFKLGSN